MTSGALVHYVVAGCLDTDIILLMMTIHVLSELSKRYGHLINSQSQHDTKHTNHIGILSHTSVIRHSLSACLSVFTARRLAPGIVPDTHP